MNYKDGNGQHNNVYDLAASRTIKKKTGQAVPIKKSSTPDSPSLIKHENEAMALGNPTPAKRTLKSSIKKGADAVTKYLGLDDESLK